MRVFNHKTRKVTACDEFKYCDTHCHLKKNCCDIWIKKKPERVVFT